MSLGLNIVRTIVDRKSDAVRINRKARELMRRGLLESGVEAPATRIERAPDARQKAIKFKRQKRAIDALPRQAQRVVEDGRALVTEAKGLGRAKR